MKNKSDKHSYIDEPHQLENLLVLLRTADRVAIDTEADSLHHYYEKICLIQLSFDDKHYLVDPLADLDIKPLIEVLKHKPLILHGADYDLRMFKTHYDLTPQATVFDTMLAAQLLGLEKLGLSDLLNDLLGVTITKSGQKSDWSRRPLTPKQIDYAVEDTTYLLSLADILNQKLKKLQRVEWHQESCQQLVKTTSTQKPNVDHDRIWRIKGSSTLQPAELNLLKHIWHWRQKQAQKANLPPFRILHNSQIIHIAISVAASPHKKPENIIRLPKHFTPRKVTSLELALKNALKTPQSKWPQHLPKKHFGKTSEKCMQRINILHEHCEQLSKHFNLPAPVIAPKAAINAIAVKAPRTISDICETATLVNWQAKLLLPAIEKFKTS